MRPETKAKLDKLQRQFRAKLFLGLFGGALLLVVVSAVVFPPWESREDVIGEVTRVGKTENNNPVTYVRLPDGSEVFIQGLQPSNLQRGQKIIVRRQKSSTLGIGRYVYVSRIE